MDDAALSGAPLRASTSTLKSAANALGFVLGLVAVAFVVVRLKAYAGRIDWTQYPQTTWAWLALLAIVSGLANALLGLAWWRTLQQVGVVVRPLWAIRAHGVSQIARYVPGNIFQFAGRQAIGMAAGLPGAALAQSVLWELGGLATVGAVYGLVAARASRLPLPFTVLACAAVVAIGVVIARRVGLAILQALALHLAFLTIYGGLFVAVLALAHGQPLDWATAPDVSGAFILAWLVGLVTPGAPAGGGIREAALLVLLGPTQGEEELLVAIVLGRMVNVVGDVGFFALASLLPKVEPHDAAA